MVVVVVVVVVHVCVCVGGGGDVDQAVLSGVCYHPWRGWVFVGSAACPTHCWRVMTMAVVPPWKRHCCFSTAGGGDCTC